MHTPIAFFIFNRPDLTEKSFACIRAQRPRQLLVVADGPRPSKPGEEKLCRDTRALISVDWECDLQTNFSESNLGCGLRMSSGIEWVFSLVDRAILLEDDCLPRQSFFRFCEEMLERYASHDKVMQITGFSHLPDLNLPDSYFFSRTVSIWGWATWRRAWAKYDYTMGRYEEYISTGDLNYFGRCRSRVQACLEAGKSNLLNTWDYQWYFAFHSCQGLAVVPKCNLIQNLGFRPDATHTKGSSQIVRQNSKEMTFPLIHPSEIEACRERDIQYLERQLEPVPVPRFRERVRGQLNQVRIYFGALRRRILQSRVKDGHQFSQRRSG